MDKLKTLAEKTRVVAHEKDAKKGLSTIVESCKASADQATAALKVDT
jgi:hypothetical protein